VYKYKATDQDNSQNSIDGRKAISFLTLKLKTMKSTDALQAVIILLLVASAASCEVAKEYSTRVFKPTMPQKSSDSTATALKFMQFDNENASDTIDLKDLASKELKETEKAELSKDTTIKTEIPVIENKEIVKSQPVDATKRGAIRNKRVRQ
jgi:hypothetical protein